MIDFQQVKDVRIPEGEVILISPIADYYLQYDKYWKKPPIYPRLILRFFLYDYEAKRPTYYAPHAFSIDKYGIQVPSWLVPKSVTYGDQWSRLAKNTEGGTQFCQITKDLPGNIEGVNVCVVVEGSTISACRVDSEDEYDNFPNGIHYFSDAIWRLSDVAGEDVMLWASATGAYSTESLIGGTNMHFSFGACRLRRPDTAVNVSPTSPCITLSSNTGGQVTISSIRSDFSDYVSKYETATSGRYSKSQYPYLCGLIFLDVSSPSTGINTQSNFGDNKHQGLHLVFAVRR